MSEIIVTAVLPVRPEAREEALAALTAGIEGTHGEEGCITYALHEDMSQPGRFVFVEKWTSAEAADAHDRSEHIQAALGVVGPLLTEPPTVIRTTALAIGDPAKAAI